MSLKKRKKALKAIYFMQMIDGIVGSLVGIFIPVFLYTLDFSLTRIFLFLIVYQIAVAGGAFVAVWLARLTGFQQTFVLRFPLAISYYLILYNFTGTEISLWLLASLGGLQAALYWVPLNILFTKMSPEKELGSSIATMMAVPMIGGIVAPFIGGLIGLFFGFKALFATAIALMAISIVPILSTKPIKADFKFSFKRGWKLFRKHPQIVVADIFDNIGGEAEGYIWPLFIFLAVENTAAVGTVASLFPLGAAIFTLWLGNYIDKGKKNWPMKTGAILVFVIWMLRYFIDIPAWQFTSSLLMGLALTMTLLPYTTQVFKIAKGGVVDEFFVFREVWMNAGRIILYLLAILLATKLTWTFPLAGLAYLYFLFL
jgi:MFS family permease